MTVTVWPSDALEGLTEMLPFFGCSGTVAGLEVLPPEELTRTSYYNKFWLEAQHPAGLPSISCLSYN